MDPEVAIGIMAVFVSGGALGAAATMLGVWVHRKLSWKPSDLPILASHDLALLRGDVADMSRAVEDLRDRLEFQEKLLAGGSPTPPSDTSPPRSPARPPA